jgi:hypothetical protein
MGVTIIQKILALGAQLSGSFMTAVGGYGSGNIFPSPKTSIPQPAGPGTADVLVTDSDGAMRARASVLTTRNNFRDDFSGAALNTALTGTLTFTAGSVTVTGTGTTFTTQVTRDMYVKLNTDGETAWTRVRAVLSNTSLELEQGYLGASGGPAASSSTKWPTRTGSGGSFTVGSSLFNILSGTTNGANSFIFRDLDFALIHVDFIALRMSQRIANQSIFAGIFDTMVSPTQQAAFIFDGTVNTTVKCRSSFGTAATDIQDTTVTLPFGLTTALTTVNYTIEITPTTIIFKIAGVVVAAHDIHTPEQWILMDIGVGIQNTAAAGSSTTVTVDQVLMRSYDIVDDGTTIPADEQHSITGQLTTTTTTADQIVLSYTVPANRVAYILGYMVNVDGNTDSLPLKIGKNTITTPPAAPGAVDSNFFRVFRLDRSGAGAEPTIIEDFNIPRQFGFAGDVLKIAVTPSGTGSTVWRATLEIILRPS